ncbi:Uncharacterised protein [Lysinibacillus sphaericus]|nr:Uncharacterised protein [Lysinibacillus sphaericus]
MSKKTFTENEKRLLSENPYVKSVSLKAITYSDEFKQLFIKESEKGKFAREIFEESGFDTEVIGMERIRSSAKRWKKTYLKDGVMGLRDTRPGNSGRSLQRERTLEEKYSRLEAQNNLLKAENELLKKIRFAERGQKKK